MGDSPIERFRGGASNLPEATSTGLGRVTVHASRWYTPVGIGVAGAYGADSLFHAAPGLIHHIPIVGGVIGSGLGTVEHLPVVGGGLTAIVAVGGGILIGQKVGGAVRRRAQAAVERNSL